MHTFSEAASEFEQFFKNQRIFPLEPKGLYGPCHYFLESGGKRIRPILCLMAHELFSDFSEEVFHAATALELFHNFTLIHDDIMDNAPKRRGRATVHMKYSQTAGILSGDVLNIYAYSQLEYLKPEHFTKVLSVFNKAAIEVCEGQQMDFEFESLHDVDNSDYLRMIELKTSVLLAAGLKMGAIIGGGNEEQQSMLYDFGKYMGIAFQLQDDYLDTFGFPEQTGKQSGGDILANKKTILFIYYHSIANDNEWSTFLKYFSSDAPDKVQAVTKMWKDADIDKFVSEMVEEYTQLALKKIDILGVPKEKTQELTDLFLKLMTRKS